MNRILSQSFPGGGGRRRLDWINRFGPADAWTEVAAQFRTDELERLVKVLITIERELDWLGGSVASPIWLFREYRERPEADADGLTAWALLNRGRNDYIPFGRMTSARSLDEWHIEQRVREEWREIQRDRIVSERGAKARRVQEAAQRHLDRQEASKHRHTELQLRLHRLRTLHPLERLNYIATNIDLPLEFIPRDVIWECVAVAASLDDKTRELLLRRIGRRRGKAWKSLWLALA